MGFSSSAIAGLALCLTAATPIIPRNTSRLSTAAQSLFDYSMQVSDSRYDRSYNYIWYQDKGQWSTRFTAWYVPGLLYRAEGDDVECGIAAIESVLATQMTIDFDAAWYGTFKVSPDAPDPTPDGTLYPPDIYNTYDPNWREFVGTQLVQIVEEFSHLLTDDLISQIEDALEIGAVGEMRRNGSYPEDDNLILAYTNPALMRALTVGWIGKRRNNQTMIDYAWKQGEDLLALYQRNGSDTLGEYNAPNYYGMDIWALAANIAYGPSDAPMTKNSKIILSDLWKDIAAHYNPYLGNLVGPYDRAYSRDATTHSQILTLFLWGIFGRENSPQPPKGEGDFLFDVAQGAALALIMDVVGQHIDDDSAATLTAQGWWEGGRFLNNTIWDDLTADKKRTATSWISAGLMIGGETVAEAENRGDQFVPAIVHWASDPKHTPRPYNGFFSLYPSASTVTAVAGPNTLTVSYPNTTQEGTNIFTFALTGIPPSWTLKNRHIVTGFDDLPCLDVNVSAPGLKPLDVAYGATLRDHWIYNISYAVPANFSGTPQVHFELEYTC